MKKILLLFLLVIGINVSAAVCTYKVGQDTYEINVNIHEKWYYFNDWRYSYTLDGKPLNEASYNAGDIEVVSADKTFFKNIIGFGELADTFSCPILVSVGTKKYTLMPYDVYMDFLAPENTIYCQDCSSDEIQMKDFKNNVTKYTFSQFCHQMTKDLMQNQNGYATNVLADIPLVGFLKYHPRYSNSFEIFDVCKNYDVSGYPLDDFKSYFDDYSDNFIFGNSSSINVCPSVLDSNDNYEIMNCLTDKSSVLKNAIENFNESCTENEMRNIQAFASGSTASFIGKRNVSGYLNNEIKLLFGSFTSECGSAADNLYTAIGNTARVLNSYSGREEITMRLRYMRLESDYLVAYSLLTNVNPNVKIEDDPCNLISPKLREYISGILNALRICGAIFVALLSIVEVYKVIVSSDGSAKKKATSLIMKRVVALVVILLIPIVVNILLDFIDDYMLTDTSQCVVNEL